MEYMNNTGSLECLYRSAITEKNLDLRLVRYHDNQGLLQHVAYKTTTTILCSPLKPPAFRFKHIRVRGSRPSLGPLGLVREQGAGPTLTQQH